MRAFTNNRREKAIAEYYKNPKICVTCGKILEIRGKENVAYRSRQDFCSRPCWLAHNPLDRRRGFSVKGPHKPSYKRVGYSAKLNTTPFKTKGETTEQMIRQHARQVYRSRYGKNFSCVVCCYDKYAEVNHIKPLRDFSLESRLFEINTMSNLVGLCPQCHGEFERGELSAHTIAMLKQGRELAARRGLILAQQVDSVN